jgi:antitoxin (DNA-binding transcriptional repressor) of toxin-antitoxin stability system
MTKSITVSELVRDFSSVREELGKGVSFVVTRQGEKIALLSPYHGGQDEAEDRGLDLDLKKIKKEILAEVLSRMEQSDSSPFDPKKDPSIIKIRKRLDNLESSIESIASNSSGLNRPEPDADTLDELEEEISSLASRVKHLEIEIKNKSGNYD